MSEENTPEPPPGELNHSREYPEGCYFARVCDGAEQGHPREVYFAPVPGRQIPPEMLSLMGEVESSATILEEIFPKDSLEHKRHFSSLLKIAQLGLLGEKANPWAASVSLENLKSKIVQSEGRRIKKAYLGRLSGALACSASAFVVISATIYFFFERSGAPYRLWPTGSGYPLYSVYVSMLSGAMLGIGLSFASRKQALTFEELFNREEVLIEPLYRILYVSGLTILLALICHLKVAGVYIAGFSTEILGTSMPCAFLFGVACGWSENLLASAVTPHIGRILTGLQQTRESSPAGSQGTGP